MFYMESMSKILSDRTQRRGAHKKTEELGCDLEDIFIMCLILITIAITITLISKFSLLPDSTFGALLLSSRHLKRPFLQVLDND